VHKRKRKYCKWKYCWKCFKYEPCAATIPLSWNAIVFFSKLVKLPFALEQQNRV